MRYNGLTGNVSSNPPAPVRSGSGKRERHTFTGQELSHAWAHRTTEWGKRSDGRMFFEQDPGHNAKCIRISSIYSHGRHFPIATLWEVQNTRAAIENGNGKTRIVVLMNRNTYSVSTSQHQGYVRYAVNHMVSWNVNDPRDPNSAKEDFVKRIATNVRGALNPRAQIIRGYIDAALVLVEEANAFSECFKLGWRLKKPKEITPELIALADEKQVKHRAAQAKRELTQELKRKEVAARIAAADVLLIEKWRIDPFVSLPWRANSNPAWTTADDALLAAREIAKIDEWRNGNGTLHWNLHGTYMRVVGDEVQTSKGARFPVAHAIKAYPIIKACHDRQTPWHTNGHTVHLGPYKLDAITPAGDVVAGCHRVPWSEIHRTALVLRDTGWDITP